MRRLPGVRWLDVEKTDGTHKSRVVATPPIESLKYLARRAERDRSLSIVHVDVTRVYVYATASRDINVRLLAEDRREGEEDMCGNLKKAIHGTRDAARNWQRKCSETLRGLVLPFGR